MPVSNAILRLLNVEPGNAFYGTVGNDSIRGTLGNDYIEGRGGADTLDGRRQEENPPNFSPGQSNGDTIGYSESPQAVTVDLNSQLLDGGILGGASVSGGHAEGDNGLALLGIPLQGPLGFENAVGSRFGDTLIGTPEANILIGLGGDDTLSGRGGLDRLAGFAGNDTLIVGSDRVILSGGTGADRFLFSEFFAGESTVTDFSIADGDRLDFSALDARADVAGDQSFNLVRVDNSVEDAGTGNISYFIVDVLTTDGLVVVLRFAPDQGGGSIVFTVPEGTTEVTSDYIIL